MDRQHLQVSRSHPWLHTPKSLTVPLVLLPADSENQGYSFQVVQPLPLPAPGSADLLGRGRNRGSPPSIHARLRRPARLSHVGGGGTAFPLSPAETLRSNVMSSSPPISLHKDLNLCLDITCFCSPLPALRLIHFHPCVPPPSSPSSSSPRCSCSLPFLDRFPCLLFFHSLSSPPSHSSSFVSLNLHEL